MTVAADMLRAALAHAERGRPVFPCGSDKKPRTPHGFLDATTDTAIVRARWLRYPGALIGLPTGAASGLIVIDLDIGAAYDGITDWPDLCAGRDVPDTCTIQTPRGGRHVYFEAPVGRKIPSTVKKIARGIDVRGDGGYVIVPPSPGYVVVERAAPAPLPAWLLGVLDPPAPPPGPPRFIRAKLAPASQTEAAERRFDAILSVVENAHEGTRHNRLYWAACRAGEMVRAGELDEDATARALVRAAIDVAGGKNEAVAAKTAKDGLARGKVEGPRA
jgi:hypothetical protein